MLDRSAHDTTAIITRQALQEYNEKYSVEVPHRAFAQSGSGAWAWRAGRTSVEHAMRNALAGCRMHNTRDEAAHPCKVINVDGRWAGEL